jgi:hypothetical protein
VSEERVETQEKKQENAPKRKRVKKGRPHRVIEIEDESGQVEEWTIQAMMGDELGEWRTEQAERSKVRDGRVTNFRGLESCLIVRCLLDRNGKKLNEKEINTTFGSEAIQELHKECLDVNGLTPAGEVREKNV